MQLGYEEENWMRLAQEREKWRTCVEGISDLCAVHSRYDLGTEVHKLHTHTHIHTSTLMVTQYHTLGSQHVHHALLSIKIYNPKL